MSTPNLQLGAYSLEAFHALLCSIVECDGRRNRRGWAHATNALEKYVSGHSGVIVQHLSPVSGNYQFLLLRIPRQTDFYTFGTDDMQTSHAKAAGPSFSDDPNAVLVVRHFGDFAGQVVASDKTFSGSVWLLPENLLDNFFRHSGLGLTLPFVGNTSHPSGGVCPREISFSRFAAQAGRGGIQRHVKGMLEVDNSIPQVSLDGDRNRINQSDLNCDLSGVRVHLSQHVESVILDVGVDFAPSHFNARMCPIDLLADFIKLRHLSQAID